MIRAQLKHYGQKLSSIQSQNWMYCHNCDVRGLTTTVDLGPGSLVWFNRQKTKVFSAYNHPTNHTLRGKCPQCGALLTLGIWIAKDGLRYERRYTLLL